MSQNRPTDPLLIKALYGQLPIKLTPPFFVGDHLIYYRNNKSNKAKTAVIMVVDMVYLHENWWEREGSLQGIEPPVRGQRLNKDRPDGLVGSINDRWGQNDES